MASSKKTRARRRPGDFLQFLAFSVIAGFLAAIIVVPPAVSLGMVTNASMSWFQDLPDDIADGISSRPSTIYAADGKTEIATFFEENREPVKLDQISQHMKNAIVSVEDRDFYNHGAVSAIGIGRAFLNNIINSNSGRRQGASTLTQQYVNNLIVDSAVARGEDATATLNGNKTYAAKIREMKLAISMEQNKSKDEILEGYLNIVNLGGSNYGVEAAAQYYWGISAKDLNVAQSALLAGLVQAPNVYDPTVNPELARERRDIVLGTMLRDGKISDKEYSDAIASDIKLNVHTKSQGCSLAGDKAFFCRYVVNYLLQDESLGATAELRNTAIKRGGLKVITTLNPEAQTAAKQAVDSTQPAATNWNDVNSALTSVEPGTGRVIAMAQNTELGSPADANDHSKTEYNYNVDSAYGGTRGFQPGSTFKPIILAQWLISGRGANATVNGTQLFWPTSFGWNAKCYDGGKYYYTGQPNGWSYKNAVNGGLTYGTAAYGIRQSLNSYLYGMLSQIDLCDVHDLSIKMHALDGTGEPLHSIPDLGTNIGGTKYGISPLTSASMYAIFASEGKYCTPRPIEKITKTDGETLKEYQNQCEQVLDPDIANGVSWVLKGVIQPGGSASQRGIGLPNGSAAKTGTNDNSSQTWQVGYTRGLSTASWVGSNNLGFRSLNGVGINGRVLNYVDGATYAGAQWQSFMKTIAPKYNTKDFTTPSDKILSYS